MNWKKLGPLALAALVMAILPVRWATTADEKPRPAAAPPPDRAGAEPSEEAAAADETPGPSSRALRLLAESGGETADLEFLVATFPDPLDTTLALDFDLALDGLQRGFAAEGFLLDRFSLPWHDREATVHRGYRTDPGALLFRRWQDGRMRRVLVLLVGETPRQGVHAAAFGRAVVTVRALGSARPLPILGPYFSGSVDSLARGLAAAGERGATVVTGAATASRLAEPFGRLGTGATFERAVPEDADLLAQTLCALTERLALPPHSVALLVEADTAYGAGFADLALRCGLEPLVVPFSGRLTSLRTALGRSVKERAAEPRADAELRRTAETELDLDLVAPGRAVDVIGELSPDAADLDDLALANLIRNLARDGYRFVGLVSTDPMDKLYLGKRLHQLAPDLLLFTFNNSLLYAHPQAGAALDGTLVVTSAPLVPEEPAPGQRQQLATETQAGILRATRALLTNDPGARAERLLEGRRHGWIVAVGGGSFWPIVTVPLAANGGVARPGPVGVRLGGRGVLALGAFFLILGLAAGWLHRSAPPRDSRHPEARKAVGGGPAPWLLAGGLALLAAAAWIGIVLGWLATDLLAPGDRRLWGVLFALAAVFAVGCAAVLRVAAWLRRREAHPVAPRALPGGEATWIPAAILLLPVLGRLLLLGWTGDQVDTRFFFQRAISLASGLSPLVALGFLGLGLFGWFLLQLKRLRVAARQAVELPRPTLGQGDEDLAATVAMADGHVAPLLAGTFPAASFRRFWGALVAIVLFTACALAPRDVVRPLTETVGYGRFYLAFVALLLLLGGLSWYRYLRLWRALRRTLARIPKAQLAGLEDPRVVAAIAWNPMGSFAWTMPKFQMMQLTADEVAARLHDGPTRDAVRSAQRAMLAAEATHDFEGEVAARHELQEIFRRLEREPEGGLGDNDGRAFRAYRVAAYLRYVFEILRNQLLTTVWLGLSVLGAVSFYDYHPRYVLTLAVSAALVGLAATVLLSFYQMETDPTLSAFAGVKATEVKSWRQLLLNLLSYALMPLLALLASRIPFLGELLRQLGNPLLQGLGGS